MSTDAELQFHPRNDTVVIQRLEEGGSSTILRPGNAKTVYELYAVVLAVGPHVEDLKVGDRIIGLFGGAIPLHSTLPVYAMSEDVVVAKVTGGEGTLAEVPPPKAGRILQLAPGTRVPTKKL